MHDYKAESISEFLGQLELFDILGGLFIFRGQAFKGNLLPGIAHKNNKDDTTREENDVLKGVKLLGALFQEVAQSTDLDLLVVAQHFGLKTRLLDWTTNPLAALWFGCADPEPGDAYVYALDAGGLLAEDVYNEYPFETDATLVVLPRLNNHRINAQHGCFTLHGFSRTEHAFVPIDINPATRECLTEFRIPAAQRRRILESLDRCGINRRTLFPDLEGLCRHLNWRCKL